MSQRDGSDGLKVQGYIITIKNNRVKGEWQCASSACVDSAMNLMVPSIDHMTE